MAKKAFEIQSSDLKLGGVNLQAGTTGVVIPGVTQATNYRVEEVEDTDDQTYSSFPTDTEGAVVVIDAAFYAAANAGGSEGQFASYTVKTDDEGKIDEIEVNTEGTYTQQESATASGSDMYAYIGSGSVGTRPLVAEDWLQIPFRPKIRAGEVENIGGSGGGVSALENLEDVQLEDPSNGQVLTWNSSQEKWENQDQSGGSSTQFVAGEGIALTTNEGDGTITISAASNATPQYGFFAELIETSSSNTVNSQAVAIDTDGNSYVSYTYYDNNENRDFSGVAKYSSTGEQLWTVKIASQNSYGRNPQINSLELVTVDGELALIALGNYYDEDTSKDVGFIYYINPVSGSVGEPLIDTELVAQSGMNVHDGVAGFDGTNTYAVVAGETYDQTLVKTFTPLAGSTTDKLYLSWADVNASGVGNNEQVYYVDSNSGGNYGVTVNGASVTATIDGTGWDGISLTISSTEAGNYVITRVNGWGGAIYGFAVPQTLRVLGSNLGGVDGVNDMTFDFNKDVFADNSNNINAAVSNIQGTPISSVFCPGYGSFDWSTQVGNALNFNYQLNNQAYIGRFGQSGSWTKNIGASSYDRINSVVVDSDLNTYAVGYVWNGSKGALVAKYDYEGGQVWAVYIDSQNYTGNSLMSVDLLSDGNLITVDEDGIVTKLDKTDGSILWQVKADNGPSWDGNFRGTATPDGDYIITNYEDDNYTQYVMRVSGSDGSSVWDKRITRTYSGDNGEINADDDAQYIDCNQTHVTVTGRSYPPGGGNQVGLVYSFPIAGDNVDGTYGQYVISSESMDWETLSTTSTAATVTNTDVSVTLNSLSPSSSESFVTTGNITTLGGEPVVEPTVIEWTNPNDNVWRIEEYNGGAAVSYNGGDYDAKWFDIANHTSGNGSFRGAIIQYHAFTNDGTIIGTIHLANDYSQDQATHTEHLSGGSNLQHVTLWDCNNDRGQLYFKMTNGNYSNLMIQWTAKVFYGSEANC